MAQRLHGGIAMLLNDERLNQITGRILAAAIEVHRVLGPGLLESIYASCFRYELTEAGFRALDGRREPID